LLDSVLLFVCVLWSSTFYRLLHSFPTRRSSDLIEPAKVRVEIQVDELKKEVPVSQKVLGEPADGRSVSEIELNRDTIDIYGDEETLESVNSVTAEIDVEGMTTSGTKDVKLDLPENVTKSEPAVLEADVTIKKD